MVRKAILSCTLLVGMLLGTVANAQQNNRQFELSVAGSMQAYVGEGETEHYLNFPVRFGVFATPNVLIEAEGIVTGFDEDFYGDTEFGYIASLNGSYNTLATEQMMPFFLLGIGFSNGVPLSNAIALRSGGPKPLVLNAGIGIKFLVSPMAALRVEYRLQDFHGEETRKTYWGDYTEKIDVTVHSMFFGVSLFL
jgi:hypothetical protein